MKYTVIVMTVESENMLTRTFRKSVDAYRFADRVSRVGTINAKVVEA